MKAYKKIATMTQDKNGMYSGEIKDKHNTIEATIIAKTAHEVHMWAFEHKCVDIELNYSGYKY
jgi:hypothetical protein